MKTHNNTIDTSFSIAPPKIDCKQRKSLPVDDNSRYRSSMVLPGRHDELEEFKSQINLCEYASSYGFTLDRKRSSRCSAIMRHANGDKLVVARAANRHWVYFNVHDDRDKGTIIDFVQIRAQGSLGDIRKKLRHWTGRCGAVVIASKQSFTELVPSEHDAVRVLAVWEKARRLDGSNTYLEQVRQIPQHILRGPIFVDRVRIGDRHNVLFPHYNSNGLCGFEVKNHGFTGFSPGGIKGLWCSRPRSDDHELVVCETSIDALSYATLFGTEGKRFVSTAGQISPAQKLILQSAVGNMASGSKIVLAMDNDPGGRKLVSAIAEALEEIDLKNKTLVTRLPSKEGEDWNDVLRQSESFTPSCPTLSVE